MLETRRARPDDAPALTAIATAAYSGYLARMPEGVRPAPLDADYAAAIAHDETWVAELDGRVVGYLVLVAAPDHLLLENVAVDPGAQGRGVGRELLDLAETRARDLGMPEVRLFTHATMVENQRLYERRGYVETGRRRDDEFDRVFYVKQLPGVVDDLLSRDAVRIWQAAWHVIRSRDAQLLDALRDALPEIRGATADVELGGGIRPNREALEHAFGKIEGFRAWACWCDDYPRLLQHDPSREESLGHVVILHRDVSGWPGEYRCECRVCGRRFDVEEGEHHALWWRWRVSRS